MNIIAGYIFTLINYLLFCFSRFCKTRKQMLALDLLAKAAFIAGLFFLGSPSGAFSMLTIFFILIAANIRERTKGKWLPLYVFFQLLLIFILFRSYAGISSILVFISTTMALASIWWMTPQQIRVAGIIGSVITLLYQLSIRNWAGLTELAVLASNIVAFFKYHRKSAGESVQPASGKGTSISLPESAE